MIRPYEVVYIFDAALEDEAIAQKLEALHALLKVEGVEAPQFNHWGRRTLAYPIRKHTTGYYVIANVETNTTLLPEFERALKLDDSVIRFLVVMNDEPPTPATAPTAKSDFEEDE